MAVSGYLEIQGITDGALGESAGTMQQGPHENESLVFAVRHNVTLPRDPKSGHSTGARVHAPLVVTKMIDKSSPLMYKALCENERLEEVVLKWFRPSAAGKMEHFFTHTLHAAHVVDVKAQLPDTQDRAKSDLPPLEEVSFTYGSISWLWVDGGPEHEDDWSTGA